MDTAQEIRQPSEVILGQVDTIIRELQDLRRAILVQVQIQPSVENLTDQLWGALAPESGKDDEYDPYLDWERFAS
ncbi:MAG: hypothetical protein IMY75_05005 [Chloroflexi bacterium]|nr:hypothetical protein [Chloroflexota bacterium]